METARGEGRVMSGRKNQGRCHQRALVHARQVETQREEQKKWLSEDKQFAASLRSEEQQETRRGIRSLQQEQHEQQQKEAQLKAEEMKLLREQRLEQEERIAREMEKIRLDQIRDEKMRLQIRENSLELRELEAKLKAGYTQREWAAQIAEKRTTLLDTMRHEAESARQMREEYERESQVEQKKAHLRWEQTVRYQQDLEQQLEEKERRKQEGYEEFLREKLMVDEIVRKIYEEDQREIELRLEKQRATQHYIQEFREKREEWKKMEQDKMEEENRKLMEFAHLQERRREDHMAQIREREALKDVLHQQLAERIVTEKQEREELEQIREELLLEEQEEAARQKEIAELEKKIRQRLEWQHTYQEALALKQLHLQAQHEEEEHFRQQMLVKFAEDDRIEQMNVQKKRMKQLEHRRAVQNLIEERRKLSQAEQERELKAQKEADQVEMMRRAIIEEERQKLLKEHAAKLLGFLPKGVFKDDKDLELFDEKFKQTYRKQEENQVSDDSFHF
ncbi:meiosis-specific nuclear structural protein 1-like isoform X1 [Lampetra fluviatilis]